MITSKRKGSHIITSAEYDELAEGLGKAKSNDSNSPKGDALMFFEKDGERDLDVHNLVDSPKGSASSKSESCLEYSEQNLSPDEDDDDEFEDA